MLGELEAEEHTKKKLGQLSEIIVLFGASFVVKFHPRSPL